MNVNKYKSLNKCIPENQYRFYYEQLSYEEKKIYDKLLEGYLNHAGSISVKATDIDKVWCIHEKICYDIPELFYIKSFKGSYNALLSLITIIPEYRFDYDTCKNMLVKMNEVANSVVQSIAMLNEREKVKNIHDFITKK